MLFCLCLLWFHFCRRKQWFWFWDGHYTCWFSWVILHDHLLSIFDIFWIILACVWHIVCQHQILNQLVDGLVEFRVLFNLFILTQNWVLYQLAMHQTISNSPLAYF